MKCSYCNAPVEQDEVFCSCCGKKIDWAAIRKPTTTPNASAHLRYCPNCNSAVQDGEQFCGFCGHRLSTGAVPNDAPQRMAPAAPPKKKPALWIPITCGVLLLAVAAFLLFYFKPLKNEQSIPAPEAETETLQTEGKLAGEKKPEPKSVEGTTLTPVDEPEEETVEQQKPEGKAMPYVTSGLYNEEQAVRLLEDEYGMKVTVLYESSTCVPKGVVSSQEPESETEVFPGDQAIIWISLGQANNIVPDLAGFDEATALQKLKEKQLNVSFVYMDSTPDMDGRVISQEPGAGTLLAAKESVSVVIGRCEAPAEPDYIIPYSSTDYVSEESVMVLTQKEAALARNEIYARHGRKFANKEIQAYFDSKEWYHGTIEPSNFSESCLSEIEKANVELIHMMELHLWGDTYY